MKRFFPFALFACAAFVAPACSVDTAPRGLRATPPGSGPQIVFDLEKRPFPDIPTPNDIATFADPTSRTGRRINASLVADTHMEAIAREGFDELEGWGTFAPIFVRFSREPGQDERTPAIDINDIRQRMQADGYELSNDSVYVVNLTTGVPALLDMGHGNFPQTIVHLGNYYPNDPRPSANNLTFETAEEGAGLGPSDYRPSLDTDFDGVLDHPNTLGSGGAYPGIDDLMTWYERETDTLVLRPLIPLEEKTEYAVVVTDRVHGGDGQPARSPFPYIHHPTQTSGVAKLAAILSDGARANYYGDIAGSGLSHVAFAWTFTTQPIVEDMRLLRDGLYGKGPFSRFATDFPAKLTPHLAAGKTPDPNDAAAGWQSLPECASPSKRPFIAHWDDAKAAIEPFIDKLFPLGPSALASLEDSLENVDYFVVGTYDSPYLVGDPASANPDEHFHLNFQTGEGDVHRDKVHFWISIPKAHGDAKPPFPVAYWHHGTTLFDTEMFIHAGRYAKNGVALVSIDAPGHGMALEPGQETLIRGLLGGSCLAPFADALASGRAVDLNGDGVADSGGLIWSAHILRTRDNVRQAALDAMQMTRILASFDGSASANQDYDGDGKPDLAGDFNGDGVVDLGGPNNFFGASGGSLGGIVSSIQGALDPHIAAAAPVSGGGGFLDIAMRGVVTPVPVLEQAIGPLVIAVPAETRANSACTKGQRAVRWYVNDLFKTREIEIACLNANELDAPMTVVVTNVATKKSRCARAGVGGTFRVPLPTSIGDRTVIEVFGAADAIDDYDSCRVQAGAPLVRRIDTWEVAATSFTAVATPDLTCTGANGCQQFRQTFYDVGSTLVAPQEGIGLRRQTPEFRKLMTLSQTALDAADPINYARYYTLRASKGVDGSDQAARPLLVVTTAGDDEVTTATGLAFARAAGALPFLPPTAVSTMPEYADFATPAKLYADLGGKTPNQLLIDRGEMEGVARLGRTPVKGCGSNYVSSATCTMPPNVDASTCQQTLYDADWLGESLQTFGQQHAAVPMRLARLAGRRVSDAASLDASWQPRIQGAPFADDGAWAANQPLVASVTAYIQATGQHDWSVGDPCQSFDATTYMDNLLAHFFATRGNDLYYLSHPKSHACLATSSCPFLQ